MKFSLPSADDPFSDSCHREHCAYISCREALRRARSCFSQPKSTVCSPSPSCLLCFPPIQLWNSQDDYRESTWARRVWCLATGIVLVAGALAAAQFARVPFFRFVPSRYSTVLPAILAAVVASWIALQSLKGTNPDQASAARFQTLAEAIPQIVWMADANGRTSFIHKRGMR